MTEQKKMTPSPVEVTLSIIGGKWKPLIVFYLLSGTKRFSELRRLLPQATQQMLTMQLRELEQAGILHRHVYAQVPPKVEYSLTELGQSMEPVLRQMCTWGEWYSQQMGLEYHHLIPETEAHPEKQNERRTLTTRADMKPTLARESGLGRIMNIARTPDSTG